MPDILLDGDDYLALGADQFTNPQKLPNGKYVSGVNVTCRGGIVQTRPGSNTLMTLPDGNLQGCTLFKPASGVVHLVAAVNGVVYVSPYPFIEYRVLPNIQFALNSQYVAWAVCLKSTDYTPEGVLYFIDNPYSVLIMQDGLTRAAYWDGSNSGHLDPTKSTVVSGGGEIITQPGKDGTPVGLWMCWANNRLWVSRGNQIFASDIGNPTKFTESLLPPRDLHRNRPNDRPSGNRVLHIADRNILAVLDSGQNPVAFNQGLPEDYSARHWLRFPALYHITVWIAMVVLFSRPIEPE